MFCPVLSFLIVYNLSDLLPSATAGEVSEAALVRDILYVFQGIDGKFIKMNAQDNCYKIDNKVPEPTKGFPQSAHIKSHQQPNEKMNQDSNPGASHAQTCFYSCEAELDVTTTSYTEQSL